MLIGHVDGPDAGSAPQVKDAKLPAVAITWLGDLDGGSVEGALDQEAPDVVLQVQALLLVLVVGKDILAGAVGMVAPSVFVNVIGNG